MHSFLYFNTYFKNPNTQEHDFDLHFQGCVLAGGTYISVFGILENGNSKDHLKASGWFLSLPGSHYSQLISVER